MLPLHELINDADSAWPMVTQWLAEAVVDSEVLPTDHAAGETALHATQVTTRSPMGAIAYHSAGILLDSGWLRILGAGQHPRFHRSLPGWNHGRSHGFYLVADDAIGGSFAINGGALGADKRSVYYYAPDTLRWEPCNFGYSQFVVWATTESLRQFYESMRWDGWQTEVSALTGDQMINFYPPLFTAGPSLDKRSRRPIPAAEQYSLQLDIQNQLDGH